MKPERRAQQAQAPVADGAITAENYQARAMAFIKARGEGVVIQTGLRISVDERTGKTVVERLESQSRHAKDFPIDEAKWHAWMVYFDALGVKTNFLRKYGLATVPTNWPEEFDTAAESSDRFYTPPPVTEVYLGRSPNVAHGFRRMSDSIKTAPRRKGEFEVTPSEADSRLSALRSRFENEPVGDCTGLVGRAQE
jgi:hypothetical protein